ncbi:gag/pol polyprotein [Gossypium australe]|uniref:Gag/pol polyprotein n=1 Tax=Gossypium australe TaxID=47621 RepID=A0A5B6WRV3_9ROSI|nr:gag/pol polyprotein [Gossypium australe]
MSAKKLSLVPGLVLPPKFKAPDFEKYDGTRCPKAHLTMFCQKMAGHKDEDKLLIHCFQESLIGSALRWYNQLGRERIQSWDDLATAFCEQYKHVSDIAPDRLTLQMMEKKPSETFRQYAQRWRDVSVQVEPPLTKTEITVLFINTLKASFYDKMVGNATKDFADVVISGELIENGIKNGRMEGSESSKRPAPVKKKEPEAHMVGTGNHYAFNSYPIQPRPQFRPPPNFYYPPQNPYYQAPPSYPVYNTNNQRPFTMFPSNNAHAPSQPRHEKRPMRPNPEKPRLTPIPVSYGELCPKLLEKQLISPHYMAPLKPPYPKWYDPNTSCMYHGGNQWHSTENCIAFKKRVQDLIDAGILRFDSTGNVAGNPLPNHTEGNVSAVIKEDTRRGKSYVSEIKTPLRKVWKVMREHGLFSHSRKSFEEESVEGPSFCIFHGIEGHGIQSCEEFRKLLQDMMNNREVEILDKIDGAEENDICTSEGQSSGPPYSADRPLVIYYEAKKEEVKPKMIIQVPSPFSYKDDRAVPWKYDVNIVAPEKPKVVAGDIGRVGHFARSGRCYSPERAEPKKEATDLNKKGKAPMLEFEVDVGEQPELDFKRPVNEDEAQEFLKFIKHSEYSIVEQLNKQPAKISVLSLLLNSESHRNALLKVLNQAYIESNVSVEKLDRWVNNLNANNFISFSDDEIPANGRGSVKALHITTSCKGYIVPNVLIDNGSALNVMPLATLSRMPVDMSYLRPCHSVVRAFDGTRREVMGKIEIPLEVGPCTYNVEFHVMDINPSYNCLLGRPWIHSAGAVPSSLHQKVKFIMDSRLVTVEGEEDIVASISAVTPYIEVNKDAVECSFRSLKFINATFVAEGNKIPTPRLSRNAKMGIKLTVGKGARARKGLGRYQQGIAKALVPTHHKARYGLGFKPDVQQRKKQLQKDQEKRMARASGREAEWEPITYPPLSKTFTSVGVMYPESENARNTLSLVERDFLSFSINAIDKTDDTREDISMIRRGPPGFVLSNWTAEDLLVVSRASPKCSDIDDVNNPVTSPRIDFEQAVCLGEFEAEENAEDYVSSPDLLRIIEQEDKQIRPHQEPVETVNLGSEERRQEVKVGTSMSGDTKHDLIALLHEYKDVFAWSYQDMPGLNEDVVVHRLPLKPECKPVQQKLRRMRPEMLLKIKEEVKKQFDAGFLQVSKYPEWVANIVPVPKKDGKVRMCVDYRDLNRASPKDNFPLPHIDTLVDNTAKHSFFSFMDGFSGYNQIKMAPEDMEKTTFTTMWGTFYYKVMPFWLKNAGATYQRVMVALFHDMMHKEIEVYVDDMITKSRGEREHIGNLKKLFERLRKFQLKLNPAKCTFGATSGKLLGFIVSERGIEVDPDKIKAIQELPPPCTQKEVRGFLGRLNYIARFIAQLTNQCDPIFRLLRKHNPGEWNEECQAAFDKIKRYLSNPRC